MDNSHNLFITVILAFVLSWSIGCSPSEPITDNPPPPTEEEAVEEDPETETEPEPLEVIEPEEEEELDEQEEMSEAEKEVIRQFSREANNITDWYVAAQQLFYSGESRQALVIIRQANDMRDNADVKALKGSIYLSLGDREKFEENWRMALEMDGDLPIPNIPYVERQLQELGLID